MPSDITTQSAETKKAKQAEKDAKREEQNIKDEMKKKQAKIMRHQLAAMQQEQKQKNQAATPKGKDSNPIDPTTPQPKANVKATAAKSGAKKPKQPKPTTDIVDADGLSTPQSEEAI